MTERERATELEFLKWFYQNADFGPADGEARDNIALFFMDDTGKNLPQGYNYNSEGEKVIDR